MWFVSDLKHALNFVGSSLGAANYGSCSTNHVTVRVCHTTSLLDRILSVCGTSMSYYVTIGPHFKCVRYKYVILYVTIGPHFKWVRRCRVVN